MSSTDIPPASTAGQHPESDEDAIIYGGGHSAPQTKLEEKEDNSKTNESTIDIKDLSRGSTVKNNQAQGPHRTAGSGLPPDLSQHEACSEPQSQALSLPETLSSQESPNVNHQAMTPRTTTSVQLSTLPPREEVYPHGYPKSARSSSPARTLADTTLASPYTPRAGLSHQPRNQGRGEGNKSKGQPTEHDEGDDSKSEIKSIMDQFESTEGSQDEDEVTLSSPETSGSKLQTPLYLPPRKSSLEPNKPVHLTSAPLPEQASSVSPYITNMAQLVEHPKAEFGKAPSVRSPDSPQSTRSALNDSMITPSPQSSISLQRAHPPEPDPEPDLPFDFHRFLEQLRHRTADPVAGFLRSFLVEFGKKQWMVHEQVKIISDFLAFITNKMAQCEVWRGVSDAEFDNAKEGMEKLVMNRLYSQTFSPAIPPTPSAPDIKGKKKNTEKMIGQARKGQHQEDIERDEILGQKVQIYGWVEEAHLDIPPVGESGRRFLSLAQQELLKIKTYRAPRDKVICVLNCCKVIFGFLRNTKSSDTSADSFVPLLIYVVLHAYPDHLVSNVQYILRFRNQDKLGGEAGYYLSSLMGAIQFIENLDRTSLTISDEDFEKKVEAAVSAIAEKYKGPAAPPRPPQISEKSALSEPAIVPRNSSEVEYAPSRRPTSLLHSKEQSGNFDGSEESTAVSGLLRTIQKPLSSIGRMFSDDSSNTQRLGDRGRQGPLPLPSETPRRLSPAVFQVPRDSVESNRSDDGTLGESVIEKSQSSRTNGENAAARQASAEAAEAQRIQRNEHNNVVETLAGMFPDLDRDVIDDVVRVKQGRVGLAVDACLALSS